MGTEDTPNAAIKGLIKGEPEDLAIIADRYFKKFASFDKERNLLIYDTGLVHNSWELLPSSRNGGLGLLKAEEAILRGIIALVTGKYPQFGFTEFKAVGKENKLLFEYPPRLFCSCNLMRPTLVDLIEQKADATQIYLKTLNNEDLWKVVILFSQNSDNTLSNVLLNWSALYAIYETIASSISMSSPEKNKTKQRAFFVDKLALNKEELDHFCSLANNARNPFSGIRHARYKHQHSDSSWNPDAISWSFRLVQDIARKWIKSCYGLEIEEPRRDISKFFDTSEMHEDEINQIASGWLSSAETYEQERRKKN